MTEDGHADDLVGSYVLEACTHDEARLVAEHASRCPSCAAEIAALSRVAEWIGVSAARVPSTGLRSRILSAALAARPADQTQDEARRLVDVYRVQVDELDRLLNGLSQRHWLLPAGSHRSVRDLVNHLHGNDGLVATVAGIDASTIDGSPSTSDIHKNWHRQAGAIIDVVARQGERLLDQQVRLAGRAEIRRPLREALIQRGFETWIHAEDVRATLRLPPQTPGTRQVADIVDFALRLLPAAMEAAGRGYPAKAIRLVLTGEGGSTRLVDLSPASPDTGAVVAEISMSAQRFCRLLAGRLVGVPTGAEIDGDRDAANAFLAVAATMGCD